MESKSGIDPTPAPVFLRMIAFGMDCLFIIFATYTVAQFFFQSEMAAAISTMEDYESQLQTLERSLQKGNQSAEAEIRRILEELVQEPSVVEFTKTMVYCVFWVALTYWFTGERFFAGSSLGKRVFSIASLDLRDGCSPGTGTCLLRALLKTIPILQQLLAVSFLVALFNRRRMAGHDYLCRTMVVRGQVASKTQEESTIHPE
ncbi:MAG: RDD family protein [Opitutales bacterium]